MNRLYILSIFLFILLLPKAYTQSLVTITVENKENIARTDEVISIPWPSLLAIRPNIDTANFSVLNVVTKEKIPFQFELQGKNTIQHLLLQVSVPIHSAITLSIDKEKSSSQVIKTYGRFVPERKEDFAWENDKIAFRMYGKELENTPKEMAYGMDVWVKSTQRMVINERYKRGRYHENLGDGMDYYHVGLTLGAGNIAPYLNDSIYYSRNYVRWKILDNGPLRTTFQLEYDNWDVAGKQVKATKTISLDAGSQLNKVQALYTYSDTSSLPIAVGIIKRKDPGTLLLDEKQGVMGYWEPEMGDYGITGVGCVFLSTPMINMKVTNQQLLTTSIAEKNKPFFYYTGAAWNKAGVYTSADQWFAYLHQFKNHLNNPLLISLK
ncbi:MAG: DUF4861 family protein [Bacteroidota bacterium]